MPAPSTSARLMALAAAARSGGSGAGIPQEGAIPYEAAALSGGNMMGGMDINSLLAVLKAGQASPEALMQLVALLSGLGGGGLPTQQMGPGGGGSEVEAAMMGA